MLQRTDDWLKARLGKATASKFDVLVTRNGNKSVGWINYKAMLVTERTTGISAENFQSKEMLWGIDNEPLARLLYLLSTRHQVEECGFFEHETLAAGASPDGLISEDGVLEIKCPNTATHIDTLKTGKIPLKYYAQVQGQLWITKRKWADFVSFDPRLPENAKMIIIAVPRDDIYIEKLEGEVIRFLEEVDKETEFIRNYGKEAL